MLIRNLIYIYLKYFISLYRSFIPIVNEPYSKLRVLKIIKYNLINVKFC